MALIKGYLGQIRGKLKGLVFSHNKGGDIIKALTNPTNPNTGRQMAIRTILNTVSSSWSSLSAATQDLWNTYGETHTWKNKLGDEIKLSGHQWYCKMNMLLADAGFAAVSTPPLGENPAAFAYMNVSFVTSLSISLAFSTSLGTSEAGQLWYTLANSLGSTPNFDQARLIGYTAADAASPANLLLPHAISPGKQSTFFLRRINQEGLMSVVLQQTKAG